MTSTHYETLEVSRRATSETIRAAFKSLMQRHHPDKHGLDPRAAIRARELLLAYEVLSNTNRRAIYDAALGQEQRSASEYAARHASRDHARAWFAPSAARKTSTRSAEAAVPLDTVPSLVIVVMAGAVAAFGATIYWLPALPLSILDDTLSSTVNLAGQWLASQVGVLLIMTLLSPTLSLLFRRKRMLLAMPLALALAFAVSSQQFMGCYYGSLETCLNVLELHR